jgi:hypothetical protein
VDQSTDRVLQLVIAHLVRLGDEEHIVCSQSVPAGDHSLDQVDDIVQMDIGLPGLRVAGKEVALAITARDAINLLRDWDSVPVLVVDAGNTKNAPRSWRMPE